VIIRNRSVQESLDNGIIGLTLVYETPDMADDVKTDWRLFPESVPKIEATTTDPFGGARANVDEVDILAINKVTKSEAEPI
jgi:hypothetical protein